MFNNFLKRHAIGCFLLKKCIFWVLLALFPLCFIPAYASEFELKGITVSNPHLVVFGKNAKSGAGYFVISNKNSDPIVLKKGMEQKVGLIRAFIKNPDILLLDECTQYVNESTQEEILNMLMNLHKEYNKTIVFISHNIKETLKIADRVAILEDGSLEQEGTPSEILQNPKTEHIIGRR